LKPCEFALIIPSFNNALYYIENLDSACWQNTTYPYHIYYINDCSTDGTGSLVAQYIHDNQLQDKITLINNEVNIGGGANIYNTIHQYIPDDQIVVILDGDDLFPHNNVLLTLEDYYRNSDIWLTYGRLQTFPETSYMGEEIEEYVFTDNLIRKLGWCSALRSFKASLYKKIKRADFLYKGKFMKVTWDLAFMLPMIEMCNGRVKHSVYIDEILYLYRVNTPLNDFRLRGPLQKEVDWYIRSLEAYLPLDTL
jgi:glycosyltransferase involved in cell wall biosynthesis